MNMGLHTYLLTYYLPTYLRTNLLTYLLTYLLTHLLTYSLTHSLHGAECYILIPLASCQQTCMTYTTVVCTVKNSWWWTEALSETYRVSFQNKFENLVHVVGFIVRNLSRCMVTWTSMFLNPNKHYTLKTDWAVRDGFCRFQLIRNTENCTAHMKSGILFDAVRASFAWEQTETAAGIYNFRRVRKIAKSDH
jgi:hypothetical protein